MIQRCILFFCCIILFSCADDAATTATTKEQIAATERPKATPSEKTAQEKKREKLNKNSSRKKQIVFFGNSLSAGYGLDKPQLGFVGLIAARMFDAGVEYQVVNGGLSGETTAGGVERVDWYLRSPIAIFVLELGGNDGLRGIDPAATKKNLQAIIDKVRAKQPETKIVLAGMEAPPNMGEKFTKNFRNLYKGLAEENDVALIPFLLEGVAGDSKLNLPDGIHPNEEGHRIVTNTIWHTIQNMF